MRKIIRYAAFFILIAIVAYNSVYFKKLDEVKAGTISFNAASYAGKFWETKLIPATLKAVEIGELLSLLKINKEKAFADHSHALGIGNVKFFLIKGEGIVESVGENQVLVKIESQHEKPELSIATEYIFGNAVRDASGAIDMNEFSNSMDFNNVSAEINKLIREKVIPGFKSKVKKGDRITFSGAIELNKEHTELKRIEVIPVSLKIVGSI
jgi:predicted lipoprotein